MRNIILLLSVCLVYFISKSGAATNKVVCYYGSWAVYRPGAGKFDVEQIDPSLCTHLIYTFVGLGEGGTVKVLDPWNDLEDNYGKGAFKRFVKLKTRNPQVKTLIAIGGWNEGSTKYSQMASKPNTRKAFVKNAVDFVLKYGFDGLDLDWEYPNQRGGNRQDVQNFVKLLQELRVAFDKHKLLLSAAVAAAEFSMSQSYDAPALAKYLDFINVMAYDLHGSWDKQTGQNSPLRPSPKHDLSPGQRQLNVEACVETWIKHGAAPSKLVLGMGLYGHSFTLRDPSNHGLSSPASEGAAGPYTRQPGTLGYNEIVEYQKQGGWKVVWDDDQKVPYMYKGDQWVGYDDTKSIAMKVEYAKKKGLGGVMLWSIETDDFNGLSGTKFALLKTINKALNTKTNQLPTTTRKPQTQKTTLRTTRAPTTTTKPKYSTTSPSSQYLTTQSLTTKPKLSTTPKYQYTTTRPVTTTTRSTTQVTTKSPTRSNENDFICPKSGYVRDPKECATFYNCFLAGIKGFRYQCPAGLKFDERARACNYASRVDCGK